METHEKVTNIIINFDVIRNTTQIETFASLETSHSNYFVCLFFFFF